MRHPVSPTKPIKSYIFSIHVYHPPTIQHPLSAFHVHHGLKFEKTPTVVSQSMQPLMRLTPVFMPTRPLPGINSWLLVHRFDLTTIPTMLFSRAYSWSTTSLATSDWSLWSLRQLLIGKESQRLQIVRSRHGGCLPSTHHASNRP